MIFFSLKSLYYQWLFVSLQRQSSPSLLTMHKSCEAFLFIHIWTWRILYLLQNGLNPRKISLICLNHEVYRFVTETKPYSTLTILVITDCLLICILCWRCPRQHICTRKVLHSKRWWCFIACHHAVAWSNGTIPILNHHIRIFQYIKCRRWCRRWNLLSVSKE